MGRVVRIRLVSRRTCCVEREAIKTTTKKKIERKEKSTMSRDGGRSGADCNWVRVAVLSVLSLYPTSAAQQQLFIHTQISLCNYTLPPLPSANTLSLILYKRRITSISQQHFHNQRVCCDHQFTDRCNERENPTRPRSSPLRLDTQASPTALRAGPCTQPPHQHTSFIAQLPVTLWPST